MGEVSGYFRILHLDEFSYLNTTCNCLCVKVLSLRWVRRRHIAGMGEIENYYRILMKGSILEMDTQKIGKEMTFIGKVYIYISRVQNTMDMKLVRSITQTDKAERQYKVKHCK